MPRMLKQSEAAVRFQEKGKRRENPVGVSTKPRMSISTGFTELDFQYRFHLTA